VELEVPSTRPGALGASTSTVTANLSSEPLTLNIDEKLNVAFDKQVGSKRWGLQMLVAEDPLLHVVVAYHISLFGYALQQQGSYEHRHSTPATDLHPEYTHARPQLAACGSALQVIVLGWSLQKQWCQLILASSCLLAGWA
jgi:hypothetical protein